MGERLTVEAWAARSARPELGEVFRAIAQAAAGIAARIRLGGLEDVYGAAGATNVQGEQQQKLDVFANEVVTGALRGCPGVAGLVSEEDEEPVVFARAEGAEQGLVLCFDPLDGSSNIDVNVNVGTIFGVRAVAKDEGVKASVLRPGSEQIAAGYVVYGPSVVFVASIRGGAVSAFTLDGNGAFVQSGEALRMPQQGPYYSANEANAASWPAVYREYLADLLRGELAPQRASSPGTPELLPQRASSPGTPELLPQRASSPGTPELGGTGYSARYIGSLVADFHRTLLKGGVFLYPPTEKAPQGKLRLQYEANPLAMIAEAAGGAAVNGAERILDLRAQGVHDRTPLVVGSKREVELLQRMVRGAQA